MKNKKCYTIIRKHITNDPKRSKQNREDFWNVMYESLADANKALVRQAEAEFFKYAKHKSAYMTIATAGKSKVAVIGFTDGGFYYDDDLIIHEYRFLEKES